MELNNGIPKFGSASFQKNIKMIFKKAKGKSGDEEKLLENVVIMGDSINELYDPPAETGEEVEEDVDQRKSDE